MGLLFLYAFRKEGHRRFVLVWKFVLAVLLKYVNPHDNIHTNENFVKGDLINED